MALDQLCHACWQPLYFYVRRHGYDEHEAKDLTREFFSRLLEKNVLATVERERGHFRYCLQTALKHFFANDWNRSQRQKRGGGEFALGVTAFAHHVDRGSHLTHSGASNSDSSQKGSRVNVELALQNLEVRRSVSHK